MTARDFAFWLQGVFEIGNVKSLDERQTELIRRHLALVFLHDIDPKEPGDPAVSQAVHDGKPLPMAPSTASPGTHPKDVLYRC